MGFLLRLRDDHMILMIAHDTWGSTPRANSLWKLIVKVREGGTYILLLLSVVTITHLDPLFTQCHTCDSSQRDPLVGRSENNVKLWDSG